MEQAKGCRRAKARHHHPQPAHWRFLARDMALCFIEECEGVPVGEGPVANAPGHRKVTEH